MSEQVQSVDNLEIQEWHKFIEALHNQQKEKPLKPFDLIETLVRDHLGQPSPGQVVLDVGCETGKNAMCLIQGGHKVVLLDIVPNALEYTKQNLEKFGLTSGIMGSVHGKIETLDPKHGPFRAVIGTYVFSFIPPDQFEEVMRKNVLGRIESGGYFAGGYFAGGFFGAQPPWEKRWKLTILTEEKLKELFLSMGFSLCQIQTKQEMVSTVLDGQQPFHTIEVIAQHNAAH